MPKKPTTTAPWLMRPAELASILRVDSKTPVRWAKAGKLASIRTEGRQHRFSSTVVVQYLIDNGLDPADAERMVTGSRDQNR